ncbi:hypothetical protein AURDEDRAFT_172636 [Auricularia subglabra TFB-10046 SS5]|nr:hypothetical protein AURDEDRAFT_172636 [Auricularia subglabra TFB-10046 SS5]
MQHLPEEYQASMRALFLEEAARNAEARVRNIEFQAAILALLQPAHPVPTMQSVPQVSRILFAASQAQHANVYPISPANILQSQPSSVPALSQQPALPDALPPRPPALPATGSASGTALDAPQRDAFAFNPTAAPTAAAPVYRSVPPFHNPAVTAPNPPIILDHSITALATTAGARPADPQPLFDPLSLAVTAMAVHPATVRYVPAAALLNARALSPGLVPLMPSDLLDPQWDKLITSFGEANMLRYEWKRHNKVLIPVCAPLPPWHSAARRTSAWPRVGCCEKLPGSI